jgi:hypothetical protein
VWVVVQSAGFYNEKNSLKIVCVRSIEHQKVNETRRER